MIPKVINYCWFGGRPFPEKAQKCIESWKKYCPDFEIKEWNEKNFNPYINSYTKRTYNSRQYAFLSDYVRLRIIEENGGFYFDTDVEIVRSIDDLTQYSAFCGFETNDFVNTGLGFGAEPHHPMLKAMLKEYDPLMQCTEVVGCPILNTNALNSFGLVKNGEKQKLTDGIIVFPSDCFNPYDDPTGKLNITKNTYSIHWYAKTWMSKKKVIRSILTKPIHRIVGINIIKKREKE